MQSSQYPKLELKYCERCGGLWLRPLGAETVYCAPCAEAVSELPPACPRGNAPTGTMQAAYVVVLSAFATLFGVAEAVGGACA
jgi:hypothetical protein